MAELDLMPWREFREWQRLELLETLPKLGADRARELGLIDERGRATF